MTTDKNSKAGDRVIAEVSVADWDLRWEHVPNGFRELQSSLGHVPGIFAAKQGARVMYIGAAAQKYAGLRAGLARGRLRPQTGNSSHGMKKVREAGDSVEAYVIRMMPPMTPKEIVHLKWLMIDYHKPPMNAPRDIVTAARKASYANRS
ncbi:hypothetical protein [Sphingomonas sp. R86520]|uniref:hypothetical protein n=1 Tax=Sphingomonas sp. R86520 TaxID=3093859 RepID=UPI0036D42326